jgi:hypothetical protein
MKRLLLFSYLFLIFCILDKSSCGNTHDSTSPIKEDSKRATLSIDLNKPAPEDSEEEQKLKKNERKRKYKKYINNVKADPVRKEKFLKRHRIIERKWRTHRFDDMTEEEKSAKVERTRKRKKATYIKRKERFNGMSSQRDMERNRIMKLEKQGETLSKQDFDFLNAIREKDRKRAEKYRLTNPIKKKSRKASSSEKKQQDLPDVAQ